jgi:hypothetical protein
MAASNPVLVSAQKEKTHRTVSLLIAGLATTIWVTTEMSGVGKRYEV